MSNKGIVHPREGDPGAKGDNKAGRVVSPQTGTRTTVPEKGKHGRSRDSRQGQPKVEIDR